MLPVSLLETNNTDFSHMVKFQTAWMFNDIRSLVDPLNNNSHIAHL